jgi:hypothetical protein
MIFIRCRNPSIGLMTKGRACKVAGQEGGPGVTSHAPRSAKSVREWTLTLPNELPLWELESQMESRIFRAQLQGQSVQRVFYIIRNLLKLKCLKWACMTHLDIWNTSYDQKNGWESNWQFDSRALKVRNWLDFLMCRWSVTYCWKVLDEGYNVALDLITIEGVHVTLCTPKVTGVLVVWISRLPLGSPDTKCHLDVALVERRREYYKRGKVVASPKSRPWWLLWI